MKKSARGGGWVIRGTDWGKDKPFTTEWNLQNRSCEPTIVTQHAGVVFDDKVTNTTLIVVVLRDIAERVWSFYQYLRRWYVPFKKRPLEFFLQAGPTYDPSSDVSFAADKGCKICMHHLHNAYVWQLASYNCPNCGALDTMPYAERVVTEDIFQRACKNLKGVVTGTLEEIQDILAHRMDSFASQFPPPFKSKCTLPHSNPTKKKSALTDATRQAIMDANRWDERLLKECLTRRLWMWAVIASAMTDYKMVLHTSSCDIQAIWCQLAPWRILLLPSMKLEETAGLDVCVFFLNKTEVTKYSVNPVHRRNLPMHPTFK